MTDTPRLTVRCEYPDTDLPPTVVTFGLSPAYDIRNAHEANEWFLEMMRQHEEFKVATRSGWVLIAIAAFVQIVRVSQTEN